MSFALKIKRWGLATTATTATVEQEPPKESTQISDLSEVNQQDTAQTQKEPVRLNEPEPAPSVANVANVARGPTLESEVIEVHNPKLRRRLEANGLCPDDALALAIKLQARKIDFDDRRICHECRHFTRKLCTNAQAAELSAKLKLFPVPVGMATTLQRCPGFGKAEL